MGDQNSAQIPPASPVPPVGTPPVVEIIPPHADPQQAPPSSKFSLSPKIMLIILAILIVAVVGSGIYLSAGSQPKQVTKSTPTPLPTEAKAPAGDPTANWKTYENKVNGYSLKYPSELLLKESSLTSGSINYVPPTAIITTVHTKNEISESIGISVYKNPNNYSLIDWIKKEVWQDTYPEMFSKYSNFTIDGESAMRTSEIPGMVEEDEVFVAKNGKIYQIDLAKMTGNQSKVIGENIYNQILSTFKFTDVGSTPTCRPRPTCLDATPRCLIPETSDMCPAKNSTESGLTK